MSLPRTSCTPTIRRFRCSHRGAARPKGRTSAATSGRLRRHSASRPTNDPTNRRAFMPSSKRFAVALPTSAARLTRTEPATTRCDESLDGADAPNALAEIGDGKKRSAIRLVDGRPLDVIVTTDASRSTTMRRNARCDALRLGANIICSPAVMQAVSDVRQFTACWQRQTQRPRSRSVSPRGARADREHPITLINELLPWHLQTTNATPPTGNNATPELAPQP